MAALPVAADGAPVAIVYPDQEPGGLGTLVMPRTVVQIRGGPHPSEAKQLIDRNTAEENAVQMRLVERLIQQQEAVVAKPATIRASGSRVR